tara:strand:+ start:565 stop:888 length:324 start_codon:yes stop_codon:yes gene_type:complete
LTGLTASAVEVCRRACAARSPGAFGFRCAVPAVLSFADNRASNRVFDPSASNRVSVAASRNVNIYRRASRKIYICGFAVFTTTTTTTTSIRASPAIAASTYYFNSVI